MSADRWQHTWDLFHQALERPVRERSEWLETACHDVVLRQEVAALLAAHEAPGGILDEPVAVAANTLLETALEDAPAEQPPPDRIGPYEIVRVLGEGGMGTVYLARRADGEIDRLVALKTVRPDLSTPELIRRFRQERQIAATLVHPSIARLLDVGTDAGGQPYLVMEYVEGEPIDRHCDAGALPLERRLELFRLVCAAVHFAHQRLVVHRDLKPGNILVGADGVPKLLDFGIAKLLESDGEEDGDATRTAVHLMTPEYASPEQVRGEPVGTASDQYSLGVLLYRLLTGRRPYRTTSSLPHDLARAVCEEEPERPSTAARQAADHDGEARLPSGLAPDRLHRRLRGDLDEIVLRALRKEPDRRYSSVAHLAEDLRLYLEGLPVVARRGSTYYRAAKHVRRHRAAFGSAAAAILLIIAAAVTFAVQAGRLGRALHRAGREQSRAERVSDFLIDVFKVSDPGQARGSTVTAREILDRGAARITEELHDEPDAAAAMMDVMGQVYANLGLYPRAQELLEAALSQRRAKPEPDDDDVAASLAHLAAVQHARGDYDGSAVSLDRRSPCARERTGTTIPWSPTPCRRWRFSSTRGATTRPPSTSIARRSPSAGPTRTSLPPWSHGPWSAWPACCGPGRLLRGPPAARGGAREPAPGVDRGPPGGRHHARLPRRARLPHRRSRCRRAGVPRGAGHARTRARARAPQRGGDPQRSRPRPPHPGRRGRRGGPCCGGRSRCVARRSATTTPAPRPPSTTSPGCSTTPGDTPRPSRSTGRRWRPTSSRLGDDHPMVAGNLNNLGLLAVDRGNLDGAEPFVPPTAGDHPRPARPRLAVGRLPAHQPRRPLPRSGATSTAQSRCTEKRWRSDADRLCLPVIRRSRGPWSATVDC